MGHKTKFLCILFNCVHLNCGAFKGIFDIEKLGKFWL